MDHVPAEKESIAVQGSPSSDLTARVTRIRSDDLFQHRREVEIDHQGRIYRLRLTQLNKLILTA